MVDEPQFTNEYFEERYEIMTQIEEKKEELKRNGDEISEEFKERRSRYYWCHPPVSEGIGNIFLFPGMLHASSHTVSLIFFLTSQLINTSGFEYQMMLRILSSFDGYLAGGDICAGSEILFQMLHQLNIYFLVCVFLFYFFVCVFLFVQEL